MATRKLLDSLVGKEVCVNFPVKDEFVGILHKSRNPKLTGTLFRLIRL